MKVWPLDKYASTTFIEINIDPTGQPNASHTPPTPLQWQQRVYDDLLCDEALGINDLVPYGKPGATTWWSHKSMMAPCRTVDLSLLNKHGQQETFAMKSPFGLAECIRQSQMLRTATTVFHCAHQITPDHFYLDVWPLAVHRSTTLGFLSSGDSSNCYFRCCSINLWAQEDCVDDATHCDSDLEQHCWRTFSLSTLIGQAGIAINFMVMVVLVFKLCNKLLLIIFIAIWGKKVGVTKVIFEL